MIEGTQGPTNEGCEGFLPILTTISGAGRRARRFSTSKEFLKGINYSWRWFILQLPIVWISNQWPSFQDKERTGSFFDTRLMAPSAPLGSAFGGVGSNFYTKIVKILFLHDFGPKVAKKKSGKISKFFFSNFPKFFSVEIFHMVCRLRL